MAGTFSAPSSLIAVTPACGIARLVVLVADRDVGPARGSYVLDRQVGAAGHGLAVERAVAGQGQHVAEGEGHALAVLAGGVDAEQLGQLGADVAARAPPPAAVVGGTATAAAASSSSSPPQAASTAGATTAAAPNRPSLRSASRRDRPLPGPCWRRTSSSLDMVPPRHRHLPGTAVDERCGAPPGSSPVTTAPDPCSPLTESVELTLVSTAVVVVPRSPACKHFRQPPVDAPGPVWPRRGDGSVAGTGEGSRPRARMHITFSVCSAISSSNGSPSTSQT